KEAAGSLIPNEILARGERAQRKFREALAKGKQQPRTLKVMFVGSGRVGKTSTLKSLCNEAFDATEASTHGLARGVCTATVQHIELGRQTSSSAVPSRRSSGEWRRLPNMQDSDFVDSSLENAVARHVAAELMRPSTRGRGDEGKPSSCSASTAAEDGRRSAGSRPGGAVEELPQLDRPSGWAPVIRQTGSASGDVDVDTQESAGVAEDPFVLKMPVDLVTQLMQGLYILVIDLAQWLDADSAGGPGSGSKSDKETASEMLVRPAMSECRMDLIAPYCILMSGTATKERWLRVSAFSPLSANRIDVIEEIEHSFSGMDVS
ncbi:unnamed protein product, partial [Prorocentrum cordatum]